jgi:hypothetical protein
VKKVEFVSDRISYIVLRGRWCNIIVLNAHAPTEEKNDDAKDSFYEELEQVFDHFPFPKYCYMDRMTTKSAISASHLREYLNTHKFCQPHHSPNNTDT